MTTLDRLLFGSYVRSYLIVLSSLLSLYIVIDLFMNLDDFTKGTLAESARHIANYYAAHVAKIFDLLSGFLTLAAALFTVAWMQRSNELLPQLSAGVSTRRAVRPLLLGCGLTLALGPLNQEFVIPAVSADLLKPRDDPNLTRAVPVTGAFDSTGVHIEGFAAFKNEKKVRGLEVTFPAGTEFGMTLSAAEAQYVPPDPNNPQSGGWWLYQTEPANVEGVTLPSYLERDALGRFFLHTRDVDFDAVTRSGSWYMYASAGQLRALLARSDPRRQPAVAVSFHRRITRPLMGLILVLTGLGVILRDQNKNVFLNAGVCLFICGLFYAAELGCKYLGDNDYVYPALAAWLPVLAFGPFALVLFDAVHT